ncbi:Sequence-specific DNA binding transcription factor [Quillaja saponaria]|uniref:Sequence-specific DNA binding transcription factor n=1 Tax=Quillaja saponaria TaxID=32244 RepID=A0AAD7VFL6_QUISA|nr:Sequence-specific DNA binding transcription factor [Quillaja saponaria]KAJ7974061.1 Sequence-specific DNA binding transcription factor [Quillaja saponaria]
MEGNLSQGGIVPGGAAYCGFDLQGSMRVHHAQQPHTIHHHQTHPRIDGFPLTMESMQNCDQTIPMADFGKGERSKNSASDEDEPSYTEEGVDCHNETSKGKKGSPWHRVKWTDKMVRLLITAVSYIGEDMDFGGGGRRKVAVLQKKGKWKSVSKVMAERGYHVSPQQCEDKFNDLNKRYKRLNDMLGRGTSCQVVENPALLDVIDYLTEKEKDDVRKILSSKHLFYEEMCSYHNGNRLHLPHDPALQHSLQLALKSRDDHDNDDVRRLRPDDLDEDDQGVETDDHDEFEEKQVLHGDNRGMYGVIGGTTMKMRKGQGQEDVTYGNSLYSQDYNKSSHPLLKNSQADMNQVLPETLRAAWMQKQWIESRVLQIEEQKLKVQVETLDLEQQRLKWQRVSKKRDRELEKMRMENERMKLENERMALELKRKEMGGFD